MSPSLASCNLGTFILFSLMGLSESAFAAETDKSNIIVILADENYNPTARCQKK